MLPYYILVLYNCALNLPNSFTCRHPPSLNNNIVTYLIRISIIKNSSGVPEQERNIVILDTIGWYRDPHSLSNFCPVIAMLYGVVALIPKYRCEIEFKQPDLALLVDHKVGRQDFELPFVTFSRSEPGLSNVCTGHRSFHHFCHNLFALGVRLWPINVFPTFVRRVGDAF